jgi:hypothetical protein
MSLLSPLRRERLDALAETDSPYIVGATGWPLVGDRQLFVPPTAKPGDLAVILCSHGSGAATVQFPAGFRAIYTASPQFRWVAWKVVTEEDFFSGIEIDSDTVGNPATMIVVVRQHDGVDDEAIGLGNASGTTMTHPTETAGSAGDLVLFLGGEGGTRTHLPATPANHIEHYDMSHNPSMYAGSYESATTGNVSGTTTISGAATWFAFTVPIKAGRVRGFVDQQFAIDTFRNPTASANLNTHTPTPDELTNGDTWTKHGSSTCDLLFLQPGRVYSNGTAGQKAFYYRGATPPSPNVRVHASMYTLTDNNAQVYGVCARMDAGSETFYLARHNYGVAGNPFQLFKAVSGVYTQIGSNSNTTPGANFPLRITLTCDDDEISASISAGPLATVSASGTDTAITDAGKVGLYSENAGSSTVGAHFHNFAAEGI